MVSLQTVQAGHLLFAALQPAGGALAGGFCVFVGGGVLHTLVKGHGDGGAQVGLDAHALLGPHENLVAVHVRGEGDALLLDVPQLSQREHLEPAAVCQDGAVPAGELADTAQLFHGLIPGPQMQVIGVAQLHLAVQVFQIVGGHSALDGPGGGYVHKGRGLHRSVDRLKPATAGGALLLDKMVHVSTPSASSFHKNAAPGKAPHRSFTKYYTVFPGARQGLSHQASVSQLTGV